MRDYRGAFELWLRYKEYFKELSWLEYRDLQQAFVIEIQQGKKKKYIEKLHEVLQKSEDAQTHCDIRYLIADLKHFK